MTLQSSPPKRADSEEVGVFGMRLVMALELFAVVFAVFLFCGAHVKLIVGGDPANADSPLLRAIWLPFYALGAVGLLLQGRRSLVAVLAALPFLLFAMLALISTYWSIDPDLTVRRSFAMIMTTIFGIYLGTRFSWRLFAELVAGGFALVALSSIVLALAVPSLGVMANEHAGAWSGVLAEKNQLGAAMVRGVILCTLAAVLAPRQRQWLWLGMTLVCFLLVLATTSKTSLLALAAGLGVIAGVRLICGTPSFATVGIWAALCCVAFLLVVVIQFPGEALELLGRDPTLTSRTDIWAKVAPFIEARPWLGYGYQAFWHNPLGPAFAIRNELDFNVQHAHNGWIETAIELGKVGYGIMAICLLAPALAALTRLFIWPYGAIVLSFVLSLFLFSLSEATLGESNGIITVLLVAFTVKLLVSEPPLRTIHSTKNW